MHLTVVVIAAYNMEADLVIHGWQQALSEFVVSMSKLYHFQMATWLVIRIGSYILHVIPHLLTFEIAFTW